jgi:D-alanyl-D-alanine carboxypeptidase
MENHPSKAQITGTAFIIISIVLAGLLVYNYMNLQSVKTQLIETSNTLDSTTAIADATMYEKSQLTEQLTSKEQEINELRAKYEKLDKKNDTLKKLTTLDKELLQKYSKVFFLNENYTPAKLDNISSSFLFDTKKESDLHEDVIPFLEDMINDADDDNVTIKVVSAYRSFDTQIALKSGYKVTYGAGTANAFSADQGYSEHQLGTTIDLTTPVLGTSLTVSFENTEAFKWLSEYAYRYGFILSYPKGNAYYQYEPWHWRFVGKDLARYLYKNKKNFYDLDQRDINKYLLEIFD